MDSGRKSLLGKTFTPADSLAGSRPFPLQSCLARIIQCAVKRCWFLVGASPTRQLVAPAGSSRSGSGGNETVEAFDDKGSLGDSANKQAVT